MNSQMASLSIVGRLGFLGRSGEAVEGLRIGVKLKRRRLLLRLGIEIGCGGGKVIL